MAAARLGSAVMSLKDWRVERRWSGLAGRVT